MKKTATQKTAFSEAEKRRIIAAATKDNGDFSYQIFLDEIEKATTVTEDDT